LLATNDGTFILPPYIIAHGHPKIDHQGAESAAERWLLFDESRIHLAIMRGRESVGGLQQDYWRALTTSCLMPTL